MWWTDFTTWRSDVVWRYFQNSATFSRRTMWKSGFSMDYIFDRSGSGHAATDAAAASGGGIGRVP
jgi:hypothetical protein